MKTKPTRQSIPDRLLTAAYSVSALLRKKKPKHLAPKKTVRFNLMVRSSSSEVMMACSRPVRLMKSDKYHGLKLSSRSCVNVAAPSVLGSPRVTRPLSSLLGQSYDTGHLSSLLGGQSNGTGPLSSLLVQSNCQSQTHLKGNKTGSLQKYIKCFNDLYLLGPILNLQRVPIKGILKNVQSSWNNNKNFGNILSAKKQLLTLTETRETNTYVQASSSSSKRCAQPFFMFKLDPNNENTDSAQVGETNVFENLMASIHNLHISAHCQVKRCGHDYKTRKL